MARGALTNRYVRRLVFTVAILAVIDPFVVPLVTALERRQYESPRVARFENSDLFTVGPIVEYLRDNPRGTRKRVVFLGDSVVWGYGVEEGDTIPAQFQLLVGDDAKVINFAVNRLAVRDATLIIEQIVDAVDVVYLFGMGARPNPAVRARLPTAWRDVAEDRTAMGRANEWLRRRVLSAWNLYTYAYRLQSALWGTSTRLFVYVYKNRLPGVLLGRRELRAPPRANPVDPVYLQTYAIAPSADRDVTPDLPHLEERYAELLRFCRLIRAHRRRAFVIDLEGYRRIDDADLPALQRLFAPDVRFVRLARPPAFLWDTLHFTPQGAATFAAMLYRATAADAGLR